MTTALVVVDVQNDFANVEGSLFVPGGNLVPFEVNRMVLDYERVVYTKDFHPPVSSHFEQHGGPWPNHCVGGTWGADFHRNLLVVRDAPVIYKGTNPGEDGYSGFYVENTDRGDARSTSLYSILNIWGVTKVDVVGIALDVCVKSTALDAVELGYYTTVIREATAPVTEEGGEAAVQELLDNGVHVA